MNQRLQAFLDLLPDQEAAIVSQPENICYLSGYTGEGVLFLARGKSAIITDFRYTEQAQQQSQGFGISDVLETNTVQTVYHHVNACIAATGVKAVGLETDIVSHADFLSFQEKLTGVQVKASPVRPQQLRLIKDSGEVDKIRKAAELTDRAFDYLVSITKPGVTELSLVARLYQFFLDNGAQGFSFSPIVASGENSSLPHAIAGNRILKEGDLVTFDIGCKVDGYCSDFTRTVALGRIDSQLKEIYGIVLEANLKALKQVAPGIAGKDLDAVARDFIAGHGYGAQFGHSLGHGVGLEIHEDPRLSKTSTHTLAEGMIVTIEPGIYIPGKGGVRIEDLVYVTKDGCEILSSSGKELLILE